MSKIKTQKKANLDQLHEKVKAVFKGWDLDTKTQKSQIKAVLKQYSDAEFYLSFLKQVADEKKDVIKKRIDLFDVLLEHLNAKAFKEAWFNCIKDLAIDSSDFPYISSCLALILKKILDKNEGKLKDYYIAYEDED